MLESINNGDVSAVKEERVRKGRYEKRRDCQSLKVGESVSICLPKGCVEIERFMNSNVNHWRLFVIYL